MLLGAVLPKLEKSGFDSSKYMVSGHQIGLHVHGGRCPKQKGEPMSELPLSEVKFKCTAACQGSLLVTRDEKSEKVDNFVADMLDKERRLKVLKKLGVIDSCEKAIKASTILKEKSWRSSELSESWWGERTSELRAELRGKLRGVFNEDLKRRAAELALYSTFNDSLVERVIKEGVEELMNDTRCYLVHLDADNLSYGRVALHGATSIAYEHPTGFLLDVPGVLTLGVAVKRSNHDYGQRVLTAKAPSEETLEALKVLFNPEKGASSYSSLSTALKACRRL